MTDKITIDRAVVEHVLTAYANADHWEDLKAPMQALSAALDAEHHHPAPTKLEAEINAALGLVRQDDLCYRQACSLATALFKRHYAKDEHYASGQVVWELCPGTICVISQIDNMVSTLVRQEQQTAVPPHAEIYMGDGLYALCDWADFDAVKGFNWNLTTRNNGGCIYAQAWDSKDISTRKQIRMHWLVLPAPDGYVVDHINGNGLDNRRANLRLVTPQQNAFNQKSHGGSSQYKGVSFDKESGLWRSYIRHSGRRIYLGRHALEIEAAKAYDMAAKEYFGEHAKLNLA